MKRAFIIKYFLLFLFCSLPLFVICQKNTNSTSNTLDNSYFYEKNWTQDELQKANTAIDSDYLSENEKEVIKVMNLARLDGKKFFETIFSLYFDHHLKNEINIGADNFYYKSLKKQLLKTSKLPMLIPNMKLFECARYHSEDMGKSGEIGHNSSNGASSNERFKRYLGDEFYTTENCSYGYDNPIFIVCQLLLDEGIQSLGHRKNILDKEAFYCGVSISEHIKWEWNCVIDFSSISR